VTGKRKVFVLVLSRDGERYRGRIKDNPANEVTAPTRESVVRQLETLALTQVLHDLRHPALPLVKEIIFQLEET
jgi:hypothetical protein